MVGVLCGVGCVMCSLRCVVCIVFLCGSVVVAKLLEKQLCVILCCVMLCYAMFSCALWCGVL